MKKLSRTRMICFRATAQEEAQLKEEAGENDTSSYTRYVLFGEKITRRRFYQYPAECNNLLREILAKLGASRVASNLNQLAKAVNSGSLLVTPETEAMIREACAAILWIRDALMKALGLKPEDNP